MTQILAKKIEKDLMEATLNADQIKKETLRQIKAEYPKLTKKIEFESDGKIIETTKCKTIDEIDDEEILDIIRKLVKSEKETLGFQNLKTSKYLEILESYLPKAITKEEIEIWVKENINFSKYKNKMMAIKDIKDHFGKDADGELIKEVVINL